MLKKIGYIFMLIVIFLFVSGAAFGSLEVLPFSAPAGSPRSAQPAPSLQGSSTPEWQQLPATPDPQDGSPAARYNHAMAYHALTNRVYIFGGQASSSTYFNDVWVLDLNTLTWDRLFINTSGTANTSFPVQRRTAIMIIDDAGQNLYVATGQRQDGTNYNDIWQFNLSNNSWTKLCTTAPCNNTTPGIRYGAAGGNLGGDLVVSHGFQGGRYDDTWRFDVSSGQWQKISPNTNLPIGRCLLDGVVTGDKFVIHGGQSNAETYRSDTWIFNTTTQTWTEVATGGTPGVNKPDGRNFQSLASFEAENGVLLFGGRTSSSRLNDVWFLDLSTNTWQELSPSGTPPAGRRSHTATWIEDTAGLNPGMLVFGGSTVSGDGSGNALNDLWLLAFPPPPPPGAPGAVQFSSSSYTVAETAGSAVLTVTRTGGFSGTVTVDYKTMGGSAIAGAHYLTASGTLTFSEGVTPSQVFTVAVLDNATADGDQTVGLILENVTGGATLGFRSAATLTIDDDETAPQSFIYLPTLMKVTEETTGYEQNLELDDFLLE